MERGWGRKEDTNERRGEEEEGGSGQGLTRDREYKWDGKRKEGPNERKGDRKWDGSGE